MSIQESIQNKLMKAFSPLHLEVVNESHQHNVPIHSETHFKVLLVSSDFEGMGRVQRQQKVYEVLKEEFSLGVHALSQRALTPKEWREWSSESFQSPLCLGGKKSESQHS